MVTLACLGFTQMEEAVSKASTHASNKLLDTKHRRLSTGDASWVQISSHLPVLALATACSCLKLGRADSLIALQVHPHFQLLPDVVQQQGACDLLTHHQHFPRQLGMSANDEAGHPLQPWSALQLLNGNDDNNNTTKK